MHEEIEAAVNWWTEQLSTQLSNKVLVTRFRTSLDKEFHKKFTGHWHVDDPPRGSGYRSVSYCTTVDPLLERAAEQAGLKSISKLIAPTRHKVMWINPGHVKIRCTRSAPNEPPEYIYRSDNDLSSPSLTSTSSTDPEVKTSELSDEDTHSSHSSQPSSSLLLTDRAPAKAPSTSSNTHSTGSIASSTHSIATTSQLNANSAEFVPSQYSSSHRGVNTGYYETTGFGFGGQSSDEGYYRTQPPEVLVNSNSKNRGFGTT